MPSLTDYKSLTGCRRDNSGRSKQALNKASYRQQSRSETPTASTTSSSTDHIAAADTTTGGSASDAKTRSKVAAVVVVKVAAPRQCLLTLGRRLWSASQIKADLNEVHGD
ncbi:hypothetical protein LAZ67_4004388 [Cordylochernes scorpioides]|uniref:Uncharacterized protein n=1 Tax=Cordylochernes scorpioides TaxID=51811 RepID=A0ABY6KEL4_9ARAC|nr:hypothetical protein LAZ67_4004388 [Cordylochernes scorpioides]